MSEKERLMRAGLSEMSVRRMNLAYFPTFQKCILITATGRRLKCVGRISLLEISWRSCRSSTRDPPMTCCERTAVTLQTTSAGDWELAVSLPGSIDSPESPHGSKAFCRPSIASSSV
eukprot:s2619_g11.t2